MGLSIIRFENDEILRDLSAVVGKIKELVSTLQAKVIGQVEGRLLLSRWGTLYPSELSSRAGKGFVSYVLYFEKTCPTLNRSMSLSSPTML
jgi:hypothetical protein